MIELDRVAGVRVQSMIDAAVAKLRADVVAAFLKGASKCYGTDAATVFIGAAIDIEARVASPLADGTTPAPEADVLKEAAARSAVAVPSGAEPVAPHAASAPPAKDAVEAGGTTWHRFCEFVSASVSNTGTLIGKSRDREDSWHISFVEADWLLSRLALTDRCEKLERERNEWRSEALRYHNAERAAFERGARKMRQQLIHVTSKGPTGPFDIAEAPLPEYEPCP